MKKVENIIKDIEDLNEFDKLEILEYLKTKFNLTDYIALEDIFEAFSIKDIYGEILHNMDVDDLISELEKRGFNFDDIVLD